MSKVKIEAKQKPVCIYCGERTNLLMIAHRNETGNMVGWIFVCEKHLEKVGGQDMSIEFNRVTQSKRKELF